MRVWYSRHPRQGGSSSAGARIRTVLAFIGAYMVIAPIIGAIALAFSGGR